MKWIRNPHISRQRGIALIAVLWTVLLLSLIATNFLTQTRTDARITRNLIDNAGAEALADAGVYRAIVALLAPATGGLLGPEVEGLLELGQGPGAVTRRSVEDQLRPLLEGRVGAADGVEFYDVWQADGAEHLFLFGGGEVRIVIEDEAGKADLNRAPDALLVELFVAAGAEDQRASDLVDAIVDFRDRDDLRRLNGAEDGDYERAGLPYGAKDAPFEAIEELQRVFGMTQALYRAVAPSITVHNRRRSRGPRALLDAPALEDTDPAEAVQQARRERANRPTVGAPVAGAPVPGASGRFPSAVTIRAQARAASGAVFVREAIVSLAPNGSQPFRIEKWKRGARFAAGGEAGLEDAPDQARE